MIMTGGQCSRLVCSLGILLVLGAIALFTHGYDRRYYAVHVHAASAASQQPEEGEDVQHKQQQRQQMLDLHKKAQEQFLKTIPAAAADPKTRGHGTAAQQQYATDTVSKGAALRAHLNKRDPDKVVRPVLSRSFDELATFVREKGGIVHKSIMMMTFGSLRGLGVTTPVPANTPLIAVPQAAWFTDSKARETFEILANTYGPAEAAVQSIATLATSNIEGLYLALMLAHARNVPPAMNKHVANVFHHAWLDMVRQEQCVSGACAQPETLNTIANDEAVSGMKEWKVLRARTKAIYEAVRDLEAFSHVSLHDVRWGYAVMQTRGFSAPVQEGMGGITGEQCLVPIVDLMNYATTAYATIHLARADDFFRVLTRASPSDGLPGAAQLMFDYGARSRGAEFFLQFGFALESVPGALELEQLLVPAWRQRTDLGFVPDAIRHKRMADAPSSLMIDFTFPADPTTASLDTFRKVSAAKALGYDITCGEGVDATICSAEAAQIVGREDEVLNVNVDLWDGLHGHVHVSGELLGEAETARAGRGKQERPSLANIMNIIEQRAEYWHTHKVPVRMVRNDLVYGDGVSQPALHFMRIVAASSQETLDLIKMVASHDSINAATSIVNKDNEKRAVSVLLDALDSRAEALWGESAMDDDVHALAALQERVRAASEVGATAADQVDSVHLKQNAAALELRLHGRSAFRDARERILDYRTKWLT